VLYLYIWVLSPYSRFDIKDIFVSLVPIYTWGNAMAANKRTRLKMSGSVGNTVRIGPRISKPIYMLAKYVYSLQNINLEDRITDLLRKDLENLTKQKWYLELHAAMAQDDVELFASALNGVKSEKRAVKPKADSLLGDVPPNDFTDEQWKDF